MGIIKGYNLQDLDIDKNSLLTLSFRKEKSENYKVNNYFKEIKNYLSSSKFNINSDVISEITLAKKDNNLLYNNIQIEGSCLWNSIESTRISPFLFDMKSNNYIVLHKNNEHIFSEPKIPSPEIINSDDVKMDLGSLNAIRNIKNIFKSESGQVDNSKSLAAILYHEIGHFVHFKWQNENKTVSTLDSVEGITVSGLGKYRIMNDGISDAMLLTHKEYTRKYHAHNNFNNSTLFDIVYSESFADNFALMMVENFFSDADNIKTKDAILNYRIKEEKENPYNYRTVSSMNTYLNQKDSFKGLELSEKIEKLIDISTKHAFSYIKDTLNKETNKLIEYTPAIAQDNEPLVNANKLEIKDHLNMLYYLGGLHTPDSQYEDINLLPISRNLKEKMGLESLIPFYALKSVQYIDSHDNEYLKKEFYYGSAKRYSMERLSGNENIILKTTKEENLESINNRMMDLNFMNFVESDTWKWKGGLILRENKMRIDGILNKMVAEKMMTQDEVNEYKNDQHQEYTSFVKYLAESEEKITSSINLENVVKQKETFKNRIKKKINDIRIVSNNQPINRNIAAHKNKPL